MAVPKPQDQEFNEENYNYDYAKRSGWNISGSKVTRGPISQESTLADNVNRSPVSRFKNNTRNIITPAAPANINAAPRVAPAQQVQLAAQEQKGATEANKALELEALMISTILMGCTGLTQVIQMYTAIIALIVGSVTWAVKENWFFNATTKVYNYVGDTFGFTSSESLFKLFMIFAGITLILNWLTLGISVLVYKLSGINSLGGEKGAPSKQITFLLAVILGNIPIVNTIPFTWFWLNAVRTNPK